MEIVLAVVADAANVSAEGKLNVFGIFDQIYAASFPVRHPQMTVALRISASTSELGESRQLALALEDSDGQRMFEISGRAQLDGPGPGPIVFAQVFQLSEITFARPGPYEFKVFIEGHLKATIPFTASLIRQP